MESGYEMACYHPLTAWYSKIKNKSGKRSLIFNRDSPDTYGESLEVPCGQCIGCRLERSRQWAVRCVHEAQMHEKNCFITLTFSDEALLSRKNPWSLDVRDFQLFMKRLRKKHGKMRFFHCGEYGDQLGRPHYHACLFGYDPDDRVHISTNDNGDRLYSSESLSRIWPHGYVTVGDVTFESAAYVARYITKKQTGKQSKIIDKNGKKHYEWIDEHGQIHERRPEYTTMSRRPGIAAGWIEQYDSDVYPKDYLHVRGVKQRPPKFYDRYLEKRNPELLEQMKVSRETIALTRADNNTPERLAKREIIQNLRAERLLRPID